MLEHPHNRIKNDPSNFHKNEHTNDATKNHLDGGGKQEAEERAKTRFHRSFNMITTN